MIRVLHSSARALAVLVIVALPVVGARADATNSTDTAVGGTPVASPLQQGGSTGGSSDTSGLLQPDASGSSPLQSADASGSGVGQSSSTQNLQQSGASDQQKLLVEGEADGAPQVLNTPSATSITWLGYVLIVLLVASAGTAAVRWWQWYSS